MRNKNNISKFKIAIITVSLLFIACDNGNNSMINEDNRASNTRAYVNSYHVNYLSAGLYHTLALDTDNRAYGWGYNNVGQIGIREVGTNQLIPRGTRHDKSFRYVYAGATSSFAISTEGKLWAWGSNNNGNLGFPNLGNKIETPHCLSREMDWQKVVSQGTAHLAIKAGKLLAWGQDPSSIPGNLLGLGNDITKTSIPTQIGTCSSWIDIDISFTNSAAINCIGELWMWGGNNYSQLGEIRDNNNNLINGVSTPIEMPIYDESGNKVILKKVSVGADFIIAISNTGELWGIGKNNYGMLGQGFYGGSLSNFTRIGNSSNWTDVQAGGSSVIALNSSGELFTWGYDVFDLLDESYGVYQYVVNPTQIRPDLNWKHISAWGNTYMAIDSNNDRYAVGQNDFGQIGDGTQTFKAIFSHVESRFKINFNYPGYVSQ